MPNNKSLDGIKKLSGQDLKKARDVVLQSIGEKSKVVKPVNSINNKEADKIEAATAKFKPKQVDGLVASQKAESRPVDATVSAGRQEAMAGKQQKADPSTLKLWRASEQGENTSVDQLSAHSVKDKEKLKKTKAEQPKHPPALTQGSRAGKKPKRRKQTRHLLSKRRANPQSRLLITSYLLLILTLIIIVGSVGFFIILYNLNNYAVLTKAGKVKQMMESGANFYQIAKSHGDEFGVGKYYTYNEAADKFGHTIVNLEAGQISIIRAVNSGYYLVECYGKIEKLIGLKYIFIKDKNLNEYMSETILGLRVWNFVD